MQAPTELVTRLEAAADRGGDVVFVCDGEREPVGWREVHDDARAMASGLVSAGVEPGGRVALVASTSRALVTAIEATWLAGGAVVLPQLPFRPTEAAIPAVVATLRTAAVALVVADGWWLDPLRDNHSAPVVGLDKLGRRSRAADGFAPAPRTANSPAVVSFTSGSSSAPKGIAIGDAQLAANHQGIVDALSTTVEDRWCSWLPLFHDMGLIAMLATPMTEGFSLVLASPAQFVRSPRAWLSWLSDYGITSTTAPSFAYALGARALGRAEGLDLSALTSVVNGAEPVDVQAFESFLDAAAPSGLRPSVACPVYGMAEATLAVTVTRAGEGLIVDSIDRDVFERERRAKPSNGLAALRLATVGRPITGMQVQVADPDTGVACADREVGEIRLRGSSMMQGYLFRPDLDEMAYRDGWFCTGDLGYLVDGRLVVSGRIKDLIIIGGRNVEPTDVEQVVATVPGMRAGAIVAFGVEDGATESLVVVAEAPLDNDGLREIVIDRLRGELDLVPREVVFVRRGTVPRTTSGKLRRQQCRLQWELKELEML
jgi:fatty-acyl-CoA synthase